MTTQPTPGPWKVNSFRGTVVSGHATEPLCQVYAEGAFGKRGVARYTREQLRDLHGEGQG